ncbi:PREDICTED: chloride channel CLIC-like protein 1 [Habropoda laboriosa]|nr:PREDICTED: chloride channel CLIC-like protein 1 [Habropoda laboriosa]
MFIIIHIFTAVVSVNCEDENFFEDVLNPEDIVDPHSLYFNKQSKKMITDMEVGSYEATDILQENNEAKCIVKTSEKANDCSNHEAIFYKRLLNLLLSNINIQEEDDVSITGTVQIEISHSQMEILQNFKVHKKSLREVDEILSNIIKKPGYNYMAGAMYIFGVLQKILNTLFETVQEYQNGAVIIFALLMVGLSFRMMKWGQTLPIFSLIQIIFVLSFFMTWWQLIQDAEIKAAAAQMKFAEIPISCQPDKMNLWHKFVSYFINDDCEQYYKIMMSNPKLTVTPALALTHFITTVILHPITHVGTVISSFISNATEDVSWTYAWIIKCMLFLCVGLVILMIPIFLSGASINLGFGPLFRIGISHQKKSEKGNSLQSIEKREPVEVILKLNPAIDLPQIKKTLEIKQTDALPVLETEREEINSDFQKYEDDLSSGDTIKTQEFLKCDKENVTKGEKHDAVKLGKNDGSGDA